MSPAPSGQKLRVPITTKKETLMSNVAETFKGMQSKFNPSAAAGLDLVFQFNITDAENYYLVVKDGTCDLQQGDHSGATDTLNMDSETMQAIVTGDNTGKQTSMA